MSRESFDPFARTAFYPSGDVDAQARALADDAVDWAGREFGVSLEVDVASVRTLDALLDRLHERYRRGDLDEASVDRIARQLGSFAGEAIRRAHGGAWGVARIYGDAVVGMRINEAAAPFCGPALARARIERGGGRTLWACYEEAVRKLTADPAAAAAIRRGVVKPRTRYRLRHDTGYFETGLISRARQVLTGFFWSGPVAIYFDAGGKLLGHDVLPLPAEPTIHPRSGLPLQTPEFDAAVDRANLEWKRKVKFFAAPIHVRRFEIAELGVGIADRPETFEEFLAAPEASEPDEAARREMIESVRAWEDDGSFVLYWGNDLWINGEGEVTAS